MTEITMPRLSDSMEEGTILTWLKADGETIAMGEELVEIETDKATMTYESPAEGVVNIVAEAGTSVAVGAVIARLSAAAEAAVTEQAAVMSNGERTAAAHEERVQEPVPVTAGNGGVPATPLARRLASAHGVDLAAIDGTGPRGRVTRADVEAKARLEPAPSMRPASPAPPEPRPAVTTAKGQPELQDLTRLQQVVARRMSEAKATVPEFQVQTEVRMDAALAMRAQLKELGGDIVPSVNDLIVKAAALALRLWPRANASYKDGRFELHPRINVGVAVAAQDALVVPTITDADTRSLGSIAAETRRLAERVRTGAVTPVELSGATFTVSNLGMHGMTAIFPVINPPQAAILGVGASRAVPALVDGRLTEHQLMTLTLTCDHRILYGADAAQFLNAIRQLLEQPIGLTL
jgi:pyruvate dehydrogenase E2 component (dihydrolipoamide acetyltransferase)